LGNKGYVIFFATYLLVLGFLFCSVPHSSVSASVDVDLFRLSYDGKSYEYSVAKNTPKSSIHTIEHQYQRFGKKGTPKQRAELMGRVVGLGFSYEQAFKYVFNNFDKFVDRVVKNIAQQKVDAKINFQPDASPMFKIMREQMGISVDKEALYRGLYDQYQQTGQIDYAVVPINQAPYIIHTDLTPIINLKSSFHTYYGSSSTDRCHNITTSLKAFNGLRLEPNKEYSFNKITGRRNEENGYRKANIIVNDEYVEGFGGGVCQTSTTIYNALLLAGLDITEVRKHSLPISYVALGFDAMVSFGSSDLKFVNRTNLPMFIKTYSNSTDIFVEVYGAPDKPDYKIKRVTEIVKRILPPPDKTVVDEKGEHADLVTFTDETATLTYPKDGYEVNGYLEFYLSGEFVDRKLIRHEAYKAQQGVLVRGAKERTVVLSNLNCPPILCT